MMGPAHSLSGAAAWLGVGALATAMGHTMPWPVLVTGALICAGAALAPDLDHKSATISRAFGPISRGLCEIIDRLSAAVYKATRGKGDPRRNGGHRTLTHTWVWAVLIGAGASAAAVTGGRWAVLALLFVHMVLAVEGLLWRQARVSSDVLVWLLGAAGAWILAGILDEPGNGAGWLFTQPGQEYLWLGLPIVLGALVHDIGDALTVSGCPILWPIPIGRRRWYPVGPPKAMRFKAGSWVEIKVLMPAFMLLGGIGGVAALNFV
ncbi:metal-dependent hydrolase [Streptomyces sp. CHA1]|uniref:metal-dependent hydrolase n=1 Tax=unclassified Streptomyces TaxID=2593676 RepID=UPI001BFCCEEA|nr:MULTISPECIES: metal-dependent hydrolase [unclassified Streptomyces]MBT3158150.1 metal-dependent hydrolase [Streptomyces sp. G11C]MCO6699257.1 metal-dependent hydrolase [Streptomyces sp. CHB9.2]MCO6705554.1 metal-dependent hydrolase [Streptomyces sp. CHA3]MCO6711312.1 metal-dependent hydrolase [Streptomyces sp. CHB19.2]MCO6717491.1 metal-dependent hydrolase [Streptomyces sp. Vc714c-19]